MVDIKRELIKKLSAIMPENEAQSELNFLLREHFNYSRINQIVNPQKINDFKEELDELTDIRIKSGKPLQYIINKAAFFDDIYYVDENVLIPRPETELLVNAIFKHADKNTKILDIGTGSGCIPISLAKMLKSSRITTCDISEEALNIAKINAKALCPDYKINFIHSDLFENIKEKFDIIVSNPPYIDPSMQSDMQKEVTGFEPHGALFAENEGMLFYEKIIEKAPEFLYKNGILAFEMGINQSEKIKKLLAERAFSKIVIIPDFTFIDRVVLSKLL